MATNFGLTTSTPATNVIQSINYLLATQVNVAAITANINGNVNLGNVVQVSSNNAIFSNVGIIGYINGYMDVKYSNSATGGSGFTSNSTMANYYGIYNSPTNSESSNPTDYQWTQVSGGFGTTKGLYYTTGGGNTISFQVATTPPNSFYQPVPDNVPIVLATISKNLVTSNSIQPQAVTNTQIATATITNVQIAANTIATDNLQAGAITTDKLAANLIIANDIQSTNATIGNYTSPGYWLQAGTGNASFAGNVSIGNNLYVNGLVTAGNLQSNTVGTTTMVTQAVSLGNGVNTTTQQSFTPASGYGTVSYYSYCVPSITTQVAGQNVYINAVASTQWLYSSGSGTIFQVEADLLRKTPSQTFAQGLNIARYTATYYGIGTGGATYYFGIDPVFTYLDTPNPSGVGTYQYYMAIVLTSTNQATISSAFWNNGTMVCQGMKR